MRVHICHTVTAKFHIKSMPYTSCIKSREGCRSCLIARIDSKGTAQSPFSITGIIKTRIRNTKVGLNAIVVGCQRSSRLRIFKSALKISRLPENDAVI